MSINRTDFIKYYMCTLATHDCDPAVYTMQYLISRCELNVEQRYWLCWLYANTYQLPTAWVIFNEFPDFENVDENRLEEWNTANVKRLRYQTDQKWMKGHLPAIFRSYKKMLGNMTQFDFFAQFQGNFEHAYKHIIKHQYKFGRFTSWFYLQILSEACGLNFAPTDLLLNQDSSTSHRNGLCLATDHPDWVGDKKLSADKIDILNAEAARILGEVADYQPDLIGKVDYFTMETALCAFKKLFRTREGRYLGYYLDRFAEDIRIMEGFGWTGIEWSLFWQARTEILLPELINSDVDKEKMKLYLETGVFCHDIAVVDRILRKVKYYV